MIRVMRQTLSGVMITPPLASEAASPPRHYMHSNATEDATESALIITSFLFPAYLSD
jgi:hypothetical protein